MMLSSGNPANAVSHPASAVYSDNMGIDSVGDATGLDTGGLSSLLAWLNQRGDYRRDVFALSWTTFVCCLLSLPLAGMMHK